MSSLVHLPICLATATAFALAPFAGLAEPDLAVTQLTVTPTKADIQTPMQVQIGLRNDGDTAVTGALFELRAGKVSTATTPQPLPVQFSSKLNLPPGASMGISTTLTLEIGSHIVIASIDPGMIIPDADRSNNSRDVTVQVTPIELSREDLAKIRELLPIFMPHGTPKGPFAIYQTVNSDLYPGFSGVYGTPSGHVGARISNGGPDAVPKAVLDATSVKITFTGAATDKTCSIDLKGKLTGDLAVNGSQAFDFYTQSNAPCPRAKVAVDTCDPEAKAKGQLTFQCLLVPELRYEVVLPTSQDLTAAGIFLIDPKPYNNVEIIPAGRY